MTYEENDELTHDLTKLSERIDEWSGREMKNYQFLNQKIDMEKELKNNIENKASKENLKAMDIKEDLVKMTNEMAIKRI